MAQRLESVSKTWDEYKGWFFLLLSGYIIWSFRGVISSLGGAANAGAEALTGGITASATSKADAAKVKAAAPELKKPVTDADVATYRADAESLASFLGQGNLGLATLFKDQQAAFSLLKQRYSRLKLVNNKPVVWTGGKEGDKNRPYKNVTVETAACVKNAVSYKVLAPFYKEATSGRNLVADIRYFVTGSAYQPFLKWIL